MKMSMVAGAVGALLSVSTAAPNALAQTAAPTLDGVKAGNYKVESYHTQVAFSLSHFGFTNYGGLFSGATGSLQLDPANLTAAKLDVTIPIQSIETTVPQ